jgi:hypothetical protein
MTKKTIFKEVNNAPNWEERINIVCQRLRIPGVFVFMCHCNITYRFNFSFSFNLSSSCVMIYVIPAHRIAHPVWFQTDSQDVPRSVSKAMHMLSREHATPCGARHYCHYLRKDVYRRPVARQTTQTR